jgi:DNA-binding MarR family transcriptional regulator
MIQKKIVFLPVWMEVLLNIDEKSVFAISEEIKVSYSYVLDTIRALEKMDLIEVEKMGRRNVVTTTKKGFALIAHIKAVETCIRERRTEKKGKR